MKKFKNISVKSFRGLKNLELENLNNINIFVGDNNVGKTSILEAIYMLSNPSFNNVLKTASLRSFNYFSGISNFDNFLNIFPKNNDIYEIAIKSSNDDEFIDLKINGHIENVLFDVNEIPELFKTRKKGLFQERSSIEIKQFKGNLIVDSSNGLFNKLNEEINYNYFSRITGRVIDYNKSAYRIHYLSPIDYLVTNVFDSIIKNEKYKEICIKVLNIFDNDIEDLVILRSEDFGTPVEYIKSKTKGLMPLYTYGDGIKKVLSIANGIAKSYDGILLIDEIETAIHSKYYDDIFKFIIKASKQFNVQLFITTHNIEALDGLLSAQNSIGVEEENISVITLRKDDINSQILSRTMSGKEVSSYREKFNFEVRI